MTDREDVKYDGGYRPFLQSIFFFPLLQCFHDEIL